MRLAVKNKNLVLLSVSVSILTLLDFLITRVYVGKVGLYGELNPFLRYAIARFGVDSVLFIKFVPLCFLFAALLIADAKPYRRITTALICVNGMLGAVVVWGAYCLFFQRI